MDHRGINSEGDIRLIKVLVEVGVESGVLFPAEASILIIRFCQTKVGRFLLTCFGGRDEKNGERRVFGAPSRI